MAGYTYVAAPRYNYTDSEQVDWYVVETITIERVNAPPYGYTRYGGAPVKNEFLKENMLKYPARDRHEGYEQLYRSDYENSSPPRYHEGENDMSNFLNKLQIGARPPMKTGSYLSGPHKYRPTSPGTYRPKSPNKYQPTSTNKYHPGDPNKYRPKSPNKYETISPNKYRPTSPNKYRPKSPNKYESTSPNKYHPTSPNMYRPKSPNKFVSTSPNKYRSTSPNKSRPKSPNKHQPTSPNKYRPSSPDKYQPTSPSKYKPTSLTYTYPLKEGNMMKPQTLTGPNKYRPTSPTKYRPASPTKYRPTSPTYNYPSTEDHMNRPQNIRDPNKYRPISPTHRSPLKEGQPIRTQILSGPNKNESSSLSVEGVLPNQIIDFSNPNYDWQSTGQPKTRRPLMAPTNDINEALGFLTEPMNYPRAQPIELEGQHARPIFGGVTNRPYLRSNTIDSHEAVRRYHGAYVP